jgi:small subunit ribosomal protein S6
MRRYESVVVLDPEVPDDDVRAFTERFSTVITTGGGEIIKIEDWGLKRLAYLVKKRDRGRYILFDFVGVPALITEMERQLKIAEDVMKFLSVKLDEEVDLEAFKAASHEAKPAETAAAAPEPAAETPEEEAETAAVEEEAPAEVQSAAPATSEEQGSAQASPAEAPSTDSAPGESETKKEGGKE